MNYVLLIYQGITPVPQDPSVWAQLPREEQTAIYNSYREVVATSGVTPGFQLQPPNRATTVRVRHAKTLTTDGPFVEMKEAVGGYLVYEADDLVAAVALAARIPAASLGGAIEVGPVVEW